MFHNQVLCVLVFNQSINRLFAHNTSSDETTQTSKRDEQDSQAPGALMAALVKHKISKHS